jgi:hypothetical protein
MKKCILTMNNLQFMYFVVNYFVPYDKWSGIHPCTGEHYMFCTHKQSPFSLIVQGVNTTSTLTDSFLVHFPTCIISSPGPKVQVNYCHHLLSVVCKLFTFQASSPKPVGQLEPSLAGMFLGWSSTRLLFFVPVRYSTGPIICSDWLKFQRSSSLKLMNWLNPNCKWMIIGISFTKLLFFMPIGNPRWPPPQDID